MPTLTLEAAHRLLLKGDVSAVYYLTGDQDILKEELTEAAIDAAVDAASRDFNLDRRSAGDVDGEALHSLVETPPMLSARRAVIIRNLEQWRANASVWKVLLKYMQQPNPTTVLILTHGPGEKAHAGIMASARHVDVDTLDSKQIRNWVLKRARRAELTIEPDAAGHLVAVVGSDLSHIATELKKLAAACPADRPVTVADIERLVGVRHGETLPDWVDAVLSRDIGRATRLLDLVLEQSGVTGVRMLMSLGSALVGVRLAQAIRDSGTAGSSLEEAVFRQLRQAGAKGLGDWRAESRRWARAAAAWSARDIDGALRAAYDADRALKSSGVSDERGVIAGLLLQFAHRVAA